MRTDCSEQLTLWNIGKQQVSVDFAGGQIVSDAGLLGIRTLDKELGVLAELAQLLPDPRAQKFVEHSKEAIFTQQVYQILAGYPCARDVLQGFGGAFDAHIDGIVKALFGRRDDFGNSCNCRHGPLPSLVQCLSLS